MADATKKDCNAVPIAGLEIVTLLVRKASAEHLMTSKIGACLELSKFIPMMVMEAMMYMTQIRTEIGVIPWKRKKKKMVKNITVALLSVRHFTLILCKGSQFSSRHTRPVDRMECKRQKLLLDERFLNTRPLRDSQTVFLNFSEQRSRYYTFISEQEKIIMLPVFKYKNTIFKNMLRQNLLSVKFLMMNAKVI